MKYVVRVNGADVEVIVDADGASVAGTRVPAHLAAVNGSRMNLLIVGDEVHRIIARKGAGRGEYTLWLDGFRFEVEALDERTRAIRELSSVASGPTGPAPLRAPMPGMV